MTALLGVGLLLGTSAPVLAHDVSYTTRETGTAECDFNGHVRTDVLAYGHHRHTRVGVGSAYYHGPTDELKLSYVIWAPFAMTWATSNQTGYTYIYSSSGGGCSN